MTEPAENLRLAERLASIASALVTPPATNGHAGGLSEADLTALAEGLVPFLDEILAPLVARNGVCEQRIVELESHIIRLEQQPTMKYLGVWDETQMYAIGDFTTHDGSLWACCRPCTAVKPGSMEGVWVLAVKRGRDAKGR